MSILRSLMDVAKDIQMMDAGSISDIVLDEDDKPGISRVQKSASYDSIAKQSKNSVMQFPFLTSRTLSSDNMQMVAKAGERNFSAFLQTLFTMNMITNADSPQEFVRQFHQNTQTGVHGPSDVVTFVFNSSVPVDVQEKIKKDVLEGNYVITDVFQIESLNSMCLPMDPKFGVTMEVSKSKLKQQVKDLKDKNKQLQKQNDQLKNRPPKVVSGGGGGSDKFEITKLELPRNVYTDGDAKKANELMPTLMQVRMYRDNGNGAEAIDFIVGVKATIHPVSSEDMINHLVAVFQDRGTLFKIITWTTGEISFFKDLILGIDQIKEEIKGTRSGKSSMWWTALKNIKAKRRMHKLTLREPILPNASLVCSIEEADYIKANYGFNIMEDESARKLVKNLNILSFFVVDAASEIVYTFVDGADHYEITTFKAMERESGNADRQFKEMLRAVNKLQ